jgi:hypothetical protein
MCLFSAYILHLHSLPCSFSSSFARCRWGEEDDATPYWIIQNSWGSGFGDRGRFKMIAGTNECIIEDEFYFYRPCEMPDGDDYWLPWPWKVKPQPPK